MTSPKTVTDQVRRTSQAIDLMLALDHESQERTLARLIAASLEPDESSALYHFATHDYLDSYGVLAELDDVEVPVDEAWLEALGHYALLKGDRP